MLRILKNIKDAEIVVFLLAFVSLVALSYGFAGFLQDSISGLKDFVPPAALYRIALTCIFSAVLFVIFVFVINNIRDKSKIISSLKIDSIFKKQVSQSSKVRIFSSGGEKSKIQLINFIGLDGKAKPRILINVLMRGDGTPERRLRLIEQAKTWKADIDERTNGRECEIVSKFAIYNGSMSLYGYIFDERCALFSWYSRRISSTYRSPASIPHIFVENSSPLSATLIDEAIKSFDDHFSSGETI